MHILHNTIGVPKIRREIISATEELFIIEPLPSGYGVTLGNSLRRVMLSSIPGARVTGIKIAGVSHEYTTLPGVRESILDMMLNIKSLVVKKETTDIEWLSITKKKGGVVTGADVKCPSGVEIMNPDCYITTVDAGFDFSLQVRVEKNVGYVSIDELKKREDDVEVLVLDANFSPVQNVKYEIKNTRYGEITSLDSLEMTVKTNGVMSPSDVVKFSTKMLESYFSLFNEERLQVGGEFISDIREVIEREKQEVKADLEKETYTPIEIM